MMNIPDIINGLFEVSGSIFVALSIRKTYKDKAVKGVAWITIVYFSAWGYWNLFYYPHLEQWWSFAGGILIVAANTIWAMQIIYYKGLIKIANTFRCSVKEASESFARFKELLHKHRNGK